ncbi:hypothetical protein [Dyella sp. A6]|uniref:hypothetical protein n=1 Tax=Dyella aluminiiresistens TaxID=3069105 RepID=UPI002E780FD4|nr:hypothetical protein [Dyella sp. A6]
MQYNQSWMAFGLLGGLEAGAISLLAGVLLYLLFHVIGRHNHWNDAKRIGWSYFVTLVLTASGDVWNLFYFNYTSGLQSLQLLQAELATVHDPDHIGMRVLFELLGAAIGVYVAWALCSGDWKRRLSGRK